MYVCVYFGKEILLLFERRWCILSVSSTRRKLHGVARRSRRVFVWFLAASCAVCSLGAGGRKPAESRPATRAPGPFQGALGMLRALPLKRLPPALSHNLGPVAGHALLWGLDVSGSGPVMRGVCKGEAGRRSSARRLLQSQGPRCTAEDGGWRHALGRRSHRPWPVTKLTLSVILQSLAGFLKSGIFDSGWY